MRSGPRIETLSLDITARRYEAILRAQRLLRGFVAAQVYFPFALIPFLLMLWGSGVQTLPDGDVPACVETFLAALPALSR
jgi:hypothetical protein